ncbi:uncharacterized protein M421DRAFT_217445 [Didymella exigua CBS 183.55]|uniref:Uncharacterized protein n=1 Tax=Didymella exigua CBS 183.55 TaxID=1150837 RepID=A0A6A5RFI4_9PLEO|nr:uncharacterized protein M421DRAFT_217445 [Didymella exigua CBS 183.55]KAF1926482.1 hypothetical protein M421DRAFT_217445 [Didymella exigua CBS 183.55]
MSQSDSDVSADTSSTIDIAQRRTGLTPSGSRVTTPYSYTTSTRDYLHQPQITPQQQQASQSSRHYATLQEHADFIMRTEHADNDVVTPRQEGRRGSFAWGLRAAYDDEAPKHSRNPMMPQRSDNHTPPTMEELVRRNTHEDDDSSICRSSLVRSDTVFSRPSTTCSSTSGTDIDSITRSDTGKSVGGLARSMTKKIPDIKPHRPSIGKAYQRMSVPKQGHPEDASSTQGCRNGRNLPFQLPSGLKMKSPVEGPQQPSLVVEESLACESPSKATSPDSKSKCSSLAARRQVKMDITLPVALPDLSNPKDLQGANPAILSSIFPSRPRSPRTPCIRKAELDWFQATKITGARTAPIIEDDEDVNAMDMIILNDAGVELGIESALPSVTPRIATLAFVRPPQKIRDRCYISRPTRKRSKSGGPSTSDSDFGNTPDGHWTPEVREGMSEQEVYTQKELVQLAKTSKIARTRRWPWNTSKVSGSDEQARLKDDHRDNRKSTSVNIFKRSSRFPEKDITEREKKEKKSSKEWNTPWKRDKPVNKPPLPSASLANMPVPPAFVPPGCDKVQTSPKFDPAGEVKGKLADFFFESNGFNARRKPNSSPGGHWDSNAVLMSMHTDMGLSNTEDDEEGPEGRPPDAFHFGPVNDTTGPMTSPGLYTGPDGYLAVKTPGIGPSKTPGSPGQDSWFRMHFGEQTPDVETLTAVALKEAEERRKFEWLVPEHLPNSPLCPLHVKYVGPSKGLCYWHGRKSNGWGVEPGRNYFDDPVRIVEGSSVRWNFGRQASPKKEKRKRRLQSLSSP